MCVCVCVLCVCGNILRKQSDYFKVDKCSLERKATTTMCKSSARVPATSSPTTVWMAMRSVVLLALTNLTASHFLPQNS